jgi:5-(carboxyamino)imidazole ribonucleotide mutase
MAEPLVLIVMGSDSDLPVMEEGAKILAEFGVSFEMRISSAHRSPARTVALAAEAAGRGIRVIIAGAGMAAHLAGVIAAETVLPVIGVPMAGGALDGLDALCSTVQMPGGIPVATMAIGKAGAKNAGIFAVQVLALGDEKLTSAIKAYRERMAEDVAAKDRALRNAHTETGGVKNK